MYRSWMVACLLLAVTLGQVPKADAQVADPARYGFSRLVSAALTAKKGPHFGQCLDVFRERKAVGTPVTTHECHDRANQQFFLLDADSNRTRIGVYQGADLRCLDFVEDDDWRTVFIDRCEVAPMWRLDGPRIRPVDDPSACLAVHPDYEYVMASLCFEDDASRFGHNWAVSQLHQGESKPIVNRSNGKCMDVQGGSRKPGASLVTYPCGGTAWQQFETIRVEINRRDRYMLSVYREGDRLCIANVSRAHPAWVQAVPCDVTDMQQMWIGMAFPVAGGFVFRYRNVHTRRCLDAFANGAVGTWPCHGGPNQDWR